MSLVQLLASAIVFYNLMIPAFAGDHAHQHGVAKVNMAISQQDVTFELIASGQDLLGFEHTPTSVQEKAAYEKMRQDLTKGESIFGLPKAAKCHYVAEKIGELVVEHGHSELIASYQFQCQQPEALKQVSVYLFNDYPHIEKVMFQGISKTTQTSDILTSKKQTLNWNG